MQQVRKATYAAAINEAFHQIMEHVPESVQIGIGVNTPWYVGQTMKGLLDRFGASRMIDTPVSENAVAGMALGAALCGLRPVLTFSRMDFMHYALDQLFNHASAMTFSLGGQWKIPLTIRAIINRGGEQGAQHSQALQGFFQHVPGFRVVMPSNAADAKGLLIAAVQSDSPVVYIEDRWLYSRETEVPADYIAAPLQGARVVRRGTDIALISSSHAVTLCEKAAEELKLHYAVEAEVIDLRSIKPLDMPTLQDSVDRTGRALIVDSAWRCGGVAAEVMASLAESRHGGRPLEMARLTLPDCHAPSSRTLEAGYYLTPEAIVAKSKALLRLQ